MQRAERDDSTGSSLHASVVLAEVRQSRPHTPARHLIRQIPPASAGPPSGHARTQGGSPPSQPEGAQGRLPSVLRPLPRPHGLVDACPWRDPLLHCGVVDQHPHLGPLRTRAQLLPEWMGSVCGRWQPAGQCGRAAGLACAARRRASRYCASGGCAAPIDGPRREGALCLVPAAGKRGEGGARQARRRNFAVVAGPVAARASAGGV